MQSARQFVEEHIKKELRFLAVAATCFGGGWRDAEQAKARTVVDISELKKRAFVTISGPREGYRSRYVLRRVKTEWSIVKVQRECPLCHLRQSLLHNGTFAEFELVGSNTNCEVCAGKGWW